MNLIGAVVTTITGFGSLIVVGRQYGQAATGVLFTGVGLFTLLGSTARLGTETSMTWFVAHARANDRRGAIGTVVRAALWRSLQMGAALAALSIVVAPPLARLLTDEAGADGEMRKLLVVLALGIPAWGVNLAQLGAMRGFGTMKSSVVVGSVIRPGVQMVALIGLVVAEAPLWALGFAWLAGGLLAAVSGQYWLQRRIAPIPVDPDDDGRAEFWEHARPRAASDVLHGALERLDVVLVGALAGSAAAGSYAAANRLVLAGQLLLLALGQAVAPQVATRLAQARNDDAAIVIQRTTVWSVLLIWPFLGVLVLGAPGIMTVFGDEFGDTANVVALLGVGLAIVSAMGPGDAVLLMTGDSRGSLINHIWSLVSMLVVAVLAIPPFGAMGAALAWVVSRVVLRGLSVIRIRRATGIASVTPAVYVVAAVAAAAYVPLGLALRAVLDDVPGLVALAVIGSTCYLGAVFALRDRFDLVGLLSSVRPDRGPRSPAVGPTSPAQGPVPPVARVGDLGAVASPPVPSLGAHRNTNAPVVSASSGSGPEWAREPPSTAVVHGTAGRDQDPQQAPGRADGRAMDAHPPTSTVTLQRYVAPIRRYLPLLVVLTLLGALAGFGSSLRAGDTYTSRVSVLVSPIGPDAASGVGTGVADVDMATEAEVARSLVVADRANAILGEEPPAKPTTELRRQVETTVSDSRVLDIAFSASGPEIAQRGAQAFAQAYLQYRSDIATQQVDTATARLDERVEAIKVELGDVASRIADIPPAQEDGAIAASLLVEQEALLDELSTNQRQLAQLRSVVTDGATVLDAASLPSSPSSLGMVPRVVGGAVAGLLVGFAIALMVDAARRTDTGDDADPAAARSPGSGAHTEPSGAPIAETPAAAEQPPGWSTGDTASVPPSPGAPPIAAAPEPSAAPVEPSAGAPDRPALEDPWETDPAGSVTVTGADADPVLASPWAAPDAGPAWAADDDVLADVPAPWGDPTADASWGEPDDEAWLAPADPRAAVSVRAADLGATRAADSVRQLRDHLLHAVQHDQRAIVVADGGDDASGAVGAAIASELGAMGRRTLLIDAVGAFDIEGVRHAAGLADLLGGAPLEDLTVPMSDVVGVDLLPPGAEPGSDGSRTTDLDAVLAGSTGAYDAVVLVAGRASRSALVADGGRWPGAVMIGTTGRADPSSVPAAEFAAVQTSRHPLVGIVSVESRPEWSSSPG